MGKIICRCGMQFRTSATSGSQVECPRCSSPVTVSEKVLNGQDRIGTPLVDRLRINLPVTPSSIPASEALARDVSDLQVSRLPPKKTNFKAPVLGLLALTILSALIAIVIFRRVEDTPKVVGPTKSNELEGSKNVVFRWSSVAQWDKDFVQYPKGVEAQSLAQQIAINGCALDSMRFWDRLDTNAFEKRVLSPGGSLRVFQDKVPIDKILGKLKSFPIDAVSTAIQTGAADWQVLGIHQRGNELGVLVRYFYEPVALSQLVNSDDWIKSLAKLMTAEEYLNVAKDLYASRSPSPTTSVETKNDVAGEESTRQTIFTPVFGYIVLIFDTSSKTIRWSDAVGLPGDVRLSRASGTIFEEDWIVFKKQVEVLDRKVPAGWNPEGTIDVFGEYGFSGEQTFAKSLVFAEKRPDAETVSRMERLSKSITQDRARGLVEIAQAVTYNYGELKNKVLQFRKDFPGDSGADALLIALWLRFRDSQRSGMGFDEFGAVFVDAAERLHIKTGDNLLLEFKSRVYASHGRSEESDKQLDLAEQAGEKTVHLYQRRLEQAIERNDKLSALKLLSQFSTYWIGLPGMTLVALPSAEAKILVRKWQEISAKPKEKIDKKSPVE